MQRVFLLSLMRNNGSPNQSIQDSLFPKRPFRKGFTTKVSQLLYRQVQKRNKNVPFLSSYFTIGGCLHDGKDKLLTVNGVVFVMDRQGKKLVRQDVMVADAVKNKKEASVPKNIMIGNQAYVRTKGGNLVRAVNKRRLKRPCPTYLRTGTCPRAVQPVNPSSDFRLCTLNHNPALQQIPLCRHFELGRCVSDSCKYLHIKMPAHAKVCKAFARDGWCEKADNCTERHVWECPGWMI